MNPLMRILAIALVLAAAGLAAAAWVLASRPAPAPAPIAAPTAVVPENRTPPAMSIVVAARDLKAGETLSITSLREARWPQAPADAYADGSALAGRVLRFDVREGQPLTPFLLARGLPEYLEPGERAVEVPVAAAADWTAIRPGDRVDLFFTLGQGGEVGVTQSRLLMARTRVLGYGDRTLDRPDPPKDARETQAPSRAVLAVPQEQVNTLLLAASRGNLQIVLRSARDADMPDTALFPDRARVLPGRPDLDTADRLRLQEPANIAYAGESLEEIAATADAPGREAGGAAGAGAAGSSMPGGHRRTVQIIRGNQASQQGY